jgi:hypothetical protein
MKPNVMLMKPGIVYCKTGTVQYNEFQAILAIRNCLLYSGRETELRILIFFLIFLF